MRLVSAQMLCAALVSSAPLALAEATTPAPEMPFESKVFRTTATVPTMASDKRGHLWLGTHDGLFRFDGWDHHRYHMDGRPKLPSNFAHQVLPLRDGRVLVALGTGAVPALRDLAGMQRLVRDNAEFIWIDGDKISGFRVGRALTVYRIAEDEGGRTWAATDRGIARLEEHRLTEVTWPPSLVAPVRDVVADARGGLWVASERGLFLIPDAGKPEQILHIAPHIAGPVTAVARSSQDELWAAERDRVFRLTPTPQGPVVVQDRHFALAIPDFVSVPESGSIHALAIDGDGNPWAAVPGGLARFDGQRFVPVGSEQGFPDPLVLSLAADQEGTVWAGTRAAGLVGMARPLARTFGARDGLSDGAIAAVAGTPDGNFWVSTADGLFETNQGRFTLTDGWHKGMGRPGSLAIDPRDDTLWLATEQGVWHRKGRRFSLVVRRDGRQPIVLAFDPLNGRLWTAWDDGGLSQSTLVESEAIADRDVVPVRFNASSGICPGQIFDLLVSRDSTLFVASEGGLSVIAGGNVTCFDRSNGIPGRAVTSLAEDGTGTLWIGTRRNSGLVRFRKGVFTVFNESNGLPCDSIHRVISDRQGRLWIACVGGIARLETSALDDNADDRSRRIDGIRFDRRDGLRSEEASLTASPGAFLAADGRLWVATLLGLVAVDDPDRRAAPAPQPMIAAVTVDGKEARLGRAAAELSFRGAKLDFHADVAAALVTNPGRLVFRHRFSGVGSSPGWSAASSGRRISRSGLTPGRYALEVSAGNGLGRWSPSAVVHFEILHPWHQTTVPWIAALVALGMVALGVQRARLHRTRTRYAAVATERARLARDLHDSLSQGFTGLTFHLDAIDRRFGDQASGLPNLIKDTRSIVSSMRVDLKRAIWSLRQNLPDDVTAAKGVEHVVNGLRKDLGAPRIDVRFDGDATLKAEVMHELLAITHEALVNAFRHARAASVKVWLRVEPGLLVLSIEDDGIGFAHPPEASERVGAPVAGAAQSPQDDLHFGVLGMLERARRVGGQLSVQSLAGRGTSVELSLPLSAKVTVDG